MKNQAHPIIVVKRRKAKKATGSTWIVEDCLCRLYDRNDGLFLVMWLDLYLQSKRADSDCGVLPDSTGDSGYGRRSHF